MNQKQYQVRSAFFTELCTPFVLFFFFSFLGGGEGGWLLERTAVLSQVDIFHWCIEFTWIFNWCPWYLLLCSSPLHCMRTKSDSGDECRYGSNSSSIEDSWYLFSFSFSFSFCFSSSSSFFLLILLHPPPLSSSLSSVLSPPCFSSSSFSSSSPSFILLLLLSFFYSRERERTGRNEWAKLCNLCRYEYVLIIITAKRTWNRRK